jgi:hypothetical protein
LHGTFSTVLARTAEKRKGEGWVAAYYKQVTPNGVKGPKGFASLTAGCFSRFEVGKLAVLLPFVFQRRAVRHGTFSTVLAHTAEKRKGEGLGRGVL